MENIETVKMSVADAEKLGISWSDICEITGGNVWAVNEGMSKDEIVDVPVKLLRP